MENLKLLRSLGFNEYEARTFLSLSELGASSAKEISEFSKVPRNKTYEVLQKLESKARIE